MQPILQKSASDDEDDLESLRLAALQSLKRPAPPNLNMGSPNNSLKLFNKKLNNRRFNCGRSNRNGSFSNRIRNTTLITVTTVETNISKDTNKISNNASKLVLPQDRYCNTKSNVEEKSEVSSKFDRYNNSNSDTDSDSNDEDLKPMKLERSNSLEALMQELENEIHGDSQHKDETLPKPKKIKRSKTNDEIDEIQELLKKDLQKFNKTEEVAKEEPQKVLIKLPSKELHKKHRLENCVQQNTMPPSLMYNNAQVAFQGTSSYTNYNNSLCPQVPFEAQLPYSYPVAPPLICVNEINPLQPVFMKYDNPLPPLKINTDILNTISAPLSPRSAAFVLQNRQIIERRKKSPRRSYSRSPSPRYRRSNTRSVSPIRRLSPKTRRPTQHYKRSSPSTTTRSNQNSPKRPRKSPPKSIRCSSEEKVNKSNDKSPSISLSPSPERITAEESKDNSTLDPVLEARRKKFENGAIPTEGIIRLRPKNEESEDCVSSTKDDTGETETELNPPEHEPDEDLLLGADDAIDFNVKMNDLFSDEESDSENEGRFKLKQNSPKVIPVKPFNQNGLNRINMEIDKKQNEKDKSYRSKNYHREKRYDRDRRDGKRSRSPLSRDAVKSAKNEKEQDIKSLMSLKIDNPRKKTNAPFVETKSEIRTEHSEENCVKEKRSGGLTVRKVEVTNAVEEVREDSDVDDDLTNVNIEGSGDLRAQLSRKRAERQHMLPKTEKISSRLLQNALQGAVFKKLKKSKKEKDLTIDGKLPIHLRLGIPGGFNVVNESKVQKKSSGKRSKSRAKYEQV